MSESESNNIFLQTLFEHILAISKGECRISDEELYSYENDENKLSILGGLKLLHEDLELYKTEYKEKLDSEYNLKILQKKNQELEQFNYMASHDLKEPIRNILMFTDILKNDVDDLSTDKAKEYLNIISDASKRMFKLIEGLLSFSTAGKELNKRNLNINDILVEIKKDLKIQFEEKDTQLIVDELPDIYADKTAMRLVFQNIISNAIKFSKEKPVVIKIDARKTEHKIQFCISDNGPGIEPEYQEKVFNLLARLHTKSEVEGAGIGLSTCKKLIEMHQGKIWVDPAYQAGTKFCFEIPTPSYKI